MAKTAVKKTSRPGGKQPATDPVPTLSSSPGASEKDASLRQLFISELKDTYWAENHLTKALPKMIAAAAGKSLQKALSDHLTETTNQVSRLHQVFELLGEPAVPKKCDAMEGLTMSGEHVIENTLTGTPVRDLGLVMAGLKVENFEITTYNGLIQVAGNLGLAEVQELLQANLDEEIAASQQLTSLSQA